MRFKHRKPLAKTLYPKNEVTATIQFKEKVNYHETFLMDTTNEHGFEAFGKSFNIPAEDTGHYKPSFWAFNRKIASFFELHKTLAGLFDWFKLREKANFEVGFLYEEAKPEPYKFEQVSKLDFGVLNYYLQRSTVHKQVSHDIDMKLRGKNDHMSMLTLLAVLIIGVVAVIAAIAYLTSGGMHPAPAQNVTVQNVTGTAKYLWGLLK